MIAIWKNMKGDKLYLHSFFVKKTEKMLLEGIA